MMAKHPSLAQRQMEIGMTIFCGQIAARDRELVVLRVAWFCQAPFEWTEHIDITKRCGVSCEEIARVIEGPNAQGWSALEAAFLRGPSELFSDRTFSEATFTVLSAHRSDAQ